MRRSLRIALIAAGPLAAGLGALAACEDTPTLPPSNLLDGSDEAAAMDGSLDGPATDARIKDVYGDIDPGPGVCDPAAAYGAPQPVPGIVGSGKFGAVTSDELTIAWMTAAGSILIADRAKATDPFGAPQTFSDPSIDLGRVALSGNGLHLVFSVSGHSTFAEVTRMTRAGTFAGPPDPGGFTSLVQMGGEDAGKPLGPMYDPVLSDDGLSLYFTQVQPKFSIVEATRGGFGAPFQVAFTYTDGPLSPSGMLLRRPTGISTDRRTLFFWDETTKVERTAYRKGTMAPLSTWSQFVDLGPDFAGAQPAGACGRIYFEGAADGGSLGPLVFADKK